MERPFLAFILSITLVILLNHLLLLYNRRRRHLPPGPLPLPIIGNLHQLTRLPHRQLRDLSRTFGPIMLIHLGNIPMIVVSSPTAAKLFLRTHDAVFSSRPSLAVLDSMPQWRNTMVFSPSNAYWRQMRRLCTQELFGETKVREFGKARREVLMKMVDCLRRREKEDGINLVDMSSALEDTMEELVCRMVMRCDEQKFEVVELGKIIREMVKLVGKFNLGDFIPVFRPFDLQGLGQRAKEIDKVLHKMLEAVVTRHEQNDRTGDGKNFVDMLLALMSKPVSKLANDRTADCVIDRVSIKAIILDIIAGGIETTSTTIDWALSEIIRNPGVLKRLQDEMDEVVGRKRMVEESDIPRLRYLEMVVKETLRLHPPGPLLAPHESYEDVMVDGYLVPKGARILVNVWAIGRDLGTWSTDAEEFRPERFEGQKVDFYGQNFEFLPFGSGRRSCPGMNIGLAMVKLSIAQLVHCFDWEMPKGRLPSDIDMSEEFGLSVPRGNSLCLIPRYRLHD
ncbi:hypothetical protein MLD38_005156 [Melastoma candidum]|uniref:Uncharacterized protein n=1 Tax=Melastoma candidum TaxID=119954 RepID=A0ACB9S845_9MYRT|nr:hypothetical protein MLD38_005156 [Melastoma candidum]